MFISVLRNGRLALCEPDDFKRLHVEAEDGTMPRDAINAALRSIAEVDGDNFWVEVAELKALGRRDPAWEASFDAMIASVQKFGWLSPDGRRVRCHLKTNEQEET
jgi:hypothetical protein